MKVIDYKYVNISDKEYEYYEELVKRLTNDDNNINGKDYFHDIFETDENGNITLIKTEKSMPWAVLFFIQQVMINQRLRLIDDFKKDLEELKLEINKNKKE